MGFGEKILVSEVVKDKVLEKGYLKKDYWGTERRREAYGE